MTFFRPLTATPFRRASYRELPPCRALAPFVRCFWEETDSVEGAGFGGTLVIPDVCADIIITISQSADRTEGEIFGMGFCGISDAPFRSTAARANKRLLAIRFFAWSVAIFSDELLCKTANGFFDSRQHFEMLSKKLAPAIRPDMPLLEFKRTAEKILLSRLAQKTVPSLVGDAISRIITSRGALPVSTLLTDLHASERQLERLFDAHIALPPKKISSLVRYQSVWQSAVSPHFVVQDAVLRHGYTDQAHLLNEFRRFHGMSLGDARRLALSVSYNTPR